MKLVERIPPTRRLLSIAGMASAGVFVSIVAHNLFYALGVKAAGYEALRLIMNALSVASFIAAIVVFPVVAILCLALALLRPLLVRT